MKSFRSLAWLLVLAPVLLLASRAFCAAPVHDALSSLEHAHSMYEERVSKIKPVGVNDILLAVVHAEERLQNAKQDRGSALPNAMKEIAGAREELETAKAGKENVEEHLKKADALVQQAVKHLYEALRQHPAKS